MKKKRNEKANNNTTTRTTTEKASAQNGNGKLITIPGVKGKPTMYTNKIVRKVTRRRGEIKKLFYAFVYREAYANVQRRLRDRRVTRRMCGKLG